MINFICIISLTDSFVTRTIEPVNGPLHDHDRDDLWLQSSVVQRIAPVSVIISFVFRKDSDRAKVFLQTDLSEP